jgi:hypothetical protein
MTEKQLFERLLTGVVEYNIGQVDDVTKRHWDRLVRKGLVLKWRGKWFPVAGGPFGLGPDKTCWCLAPGALC